MQDHDSAQSPDPGGPYPAGAARVYWRRNLRRVGVLLAVWLLLTLAPALFTGWLAFDFIGWPFPFWLAAYGAPLVYLIIVAAYVRLMGRADRSARKS
nr:sodium/substrate symporter small subunit [Bordetella sp. FB-8]